MRIMQGLVASLATFVSWLTSSYPWRHHHMETISVLLALCKVYPSQYICVFGIFGVWYTVSLKSCWTSNRFTIGLIWYYAHQTSRQYDDLIKWKHIPRHWPFVRGIHRSPVNSPHKGQWRVHFISCLLVYYLWYNNIRITASWFDTEPNC